eukprot:359284_1
MSYGKLIFTAWFSRIIHVFDVIIIIVFIILECNHIKQNNHCFSLSTIFSILTMVSCALLAVFRMITYIPSICMSFLPFVPVFYMNKNSLLTFYQIRRLQNNFSQHTLFPIQFQQYKKSSFIILYILGLLLMITFPCSLLYQLPAFVIPYLGCVPNDSVGAEKIMMLTISLVYYIWDMIVLCMYIISIIRIKREIKLNDKPLVYHKIKVILTQIVSLTVCYELMTLLYTIILMAIKQQGERQNILGAVISSLDILMPVFTLYLMSEHNHNKYVQYANIFYNFFNCCNQENRNNIKLFCRFKFTKQERIYFSFFAA